MFSTTQTPSRPKPPSQLRRSVNNTNNNSTSKEGISHSPPPPYHISPESQSVVSAHPGLHRRNLSVCSVSSTSNMDASVAATAQLLGLELPSHAPDTTEDGADAEREREKEEAYVREKSREELERLLLKAEAVIRARERELGIAAAVGKQLLETNLTLRQRHASIVSKASPRLPSLSPLVLSSTSVSMDALSPPMTPIASPSVYQRTPLLGNTGSGSRHSRRMSTTPAQLAMLNNQNEELLTALANLQDDTAAADLEGKQKLRRLEKEIAGLRAELESTHQKNEELETKIDHVQTEQGNQRQKNRDDPESDVRGNDLEDENPNYDGFTFPNFAPTSSTPMKRAFGKNSAGESQEGSASEEKKLVTFPSSDPLDSETPSAEYVLLSKLLSKIEELENTNRQILARHRETDSRLRNATTRSDALHKVYASLEDEIENNDDELHVDADDEFEDGLLSPNPSFSPAEYGSFRASKGKESTGMRGLSVVFEPLEESSREEEPSLRERGSPVPSLHRADSGLTPILSAPNSVRSKQSRKALSPRLFDNTHEDSSSALSSTTFRDSDRRRDHDFGEESNLQGVFSDLVGDRSRPSGLRPKASDASLGSARRKLKPKASLDARLSSSIRHAALSPKRVIRPSASYQGLRERTNHEQTTSPTGNRGETLWNELKALADDEFINSGDNHDVPRTIDSILYEHEAPLDESLMPKREVRAHLDDDEQTRDMHRHEFDERDRENRAVAAIRHALDPRNAGRPLNDNEHILPVGSLEGSPGESFFLISHAVAARPTKWTSVRATSSPYLDAAARHRKRIEPTEDSRRNARADSLYGVDGSVVAARRAVALERLNEAAQGRASGRRPQSGRGNRRREDDDLDAIPREEDTGAVALRGDKRRKDGNAAQDGFGQTLLELWIILQAAIILVVFVYSMARRGPRAILDAAEVRRRPN